MHPVALPPPFPTFAPSHVSTPATSNIKYPTSNILEEPVLWPSFVISSGLPTKSPHPQITFHTPLGPSDLARHMQESAIFLSVSRYERLGLAPVEAGACGCVVLFDVKFLKNVFRKGELLLQNDKATTCALSCSGRGAKSFIARFFP